MGNVLSKEKREQVIALGRLGWSLRRIEKATGVRRETAGDYLRSAGIALRTPGGWGRKPPAKPANEVITDSGDPNSVDSSKPANEVITDSGAAKPVIPVIPDPLDPNPNTPTPKTFLRREKQLQLQNRP